MPVRRGRKGKQGSTGGGAKPAAMTTAPPPPPAAVLDSATRPPPPPSVTTTTHTQQQQQHRHSTNSVVTLNAMNDNNSGSDDNDTNNKHHHLILTSDKRRGVYECDYCGCDVSQTPRIRCALCVDFDVCCDCFITTDPKTAIARLQTAQQASQWDGGAFGLSSSSSSTSSLMPPPQHDPLTHGYRVCDSTRYPLFPINAAVVAATTNSVGATAISSNTHTIQNNTSNNNNNNSNNNNNNLTSSLSPRKKRIKTVESGTTANDDDLEPSSDDMDGVEVYEKSEHPETTETNSDTATTIEPIIMAAGDDNNKTVWTMEEDLRLLSGIQTHGLGNWTEISDAVAGHGSYGKTPKRCMERYFDDYMGRYGCIVPPYTLIGEASAVVGTATGTVGATSTTTATSQNTDTDDDTETIVTTNVGDGDKDINNNTTTLAPTASTPGTTTTTTEVAIRSSKRRSTMLRTPGSSGASTLPVAKKYLAVPTESLPEYQHVSLKPFLPQLDSGSVSIGQEVGRDQTTRAELAYVRTISGLDNKEQVDRIRRDWEMNRLNQPGGPTVLPLRPDDIPKLPGSEIAGYMPRRGDFDIEYENNAEDAIADMEFLPGESEHDRNLKLAVLAIYHSKLVERNKRKQFIISRKLYDYKSYQEEYQKLPRDERDLVLRMRLFERFHTPEEHKIFIADLLKAKRLRKEIAKLQMYRRIGIRTPLEAERYEIDKARRLFHKNTVAASDHNDATAKIEVSTPGTATGSTLIGSLTNASTTTSTMIGDNSNNPESAASSSSVLYWKQYRTTDRKVRRSVNRGASSDETSNAVLLQQLATSSEATTGKSEDDVVIGSTGRNSQTVSSLPVIGPDDDDVPIKKAGMSDAMEVDGPSSSEKLVTTGTTIDGQNGNDALDATTTTKTTNDNGDDDDDDNDRPLPGYHQLSSREVDLIRSIQISPRQYIQIKKALIYESLQQGLLVSSNNYNTNNDSRDLTTTRTADKNSKSNDEHEIPDSRRVRRTSVSSNSSSGHRIMNHNNHTVKEEDVTFDNSTTTTATIRAVPPPPPTTNTVFVLDVERRGTIIDFILKAGWIPTRYGKSVRDS